MHAPPDQVREDLPSALELPASAAEVPPPPEILSPPPSAFDFLAVFRHRNYRLFFAGQVISLTGNWITNVAQGWLVYALTHSPLLLGLVTFAGQVPVFFFSMWGGMICDRVDRRRMLILTQSLAMAQSGTLAILALTHQIQVWQIVALALFQGLVNAFDVPARQAMTVDMVGRHDLRRAISLNSIMFNLARMVGPAIAGLLIAVAGPGLCFCLDALSYAAVIASLARMKFPPLPHRRHAAPWHAIRQGFAYAWKTREIRSSLLLVAGCSAFGAAYVPMLPAMARDVLHRDSMGLGFLYGAVGVGALAGAYMLLRVPDRHLMLTPRAAALGFGLSLLAFSQSHWYAASLILLMPSAFFLVLLGGSTNSIVQLASRDDMRGRVVALYAMGFMGMVPWGSLILGGIAEHLGPAPAIAIGASLCILAAFAGLVGSIRKSAGQSPFPDLS